MYHFHLQLHVRRTMVLAHINAKYFQRTVNFSIWNNMCAVCSSVVGFFLLPPKSLSHSWLQWTQQVMMNNKQTDWFVDFDLGMILICFESETEEKNRRRKLQLNHFCCCLPIVCRLFLSVCHKMFSSNIAIVIDHLLHQRNRIQHTHTRAYTGIGLQWQRFRFIFWANRRVITDMVCHVWAWAYEEPNATGDYAIGNRSFRPWKIV